MVSPKKSLGQHFLIDEEIIDKIILAFKDSFKAELVFEIGPGTGVLTEHLFSDYKSKLFVCEIDERMVVLLKKKYPGFTANIIEEDILSLNWKKYFNNRSVAVIGNFPYNISTEIIFRIIDNREQIPTVIGMFQKEVAKRFASIHGNKEYGITSILTQAYYDIEYLFDVNENSFRPPPKVKSGVIKMTRKENPLHINDHIFFKKLVKVGFNQRRKTLRNALSSFNISSIQKPIFGLRAEQLSVENWIELSNDLKPNA